jgi:mycothiol synthase
VITAVDLLSPAEVQAVRALVAASPGAADNPPISEDGMLGLAGPGRHLLARTGGELTGYARVGADRSAELVSSDLATAQALIDALGTGVQLWAHGRASTAGLAARARGLAAVRTLLQLRVSLHRLDPLPVPDGIELRPFSPGTDEDAWLAVNARAFAHHPEQGGWTRQDLDQRIAADWFDPAGFLLAWRGAQLLGFHWTKEHHEFQPPLGEVYVLGVDPDAQGLRLGTVLLNAGLRHLLERGRHTILLYVEADNTAAVHLYEKAGFAVFSDDLQYAL